VSLRVIRGGRPLSDAIIEPVTDPESLRQARLLALQGTPPPEIERELGVTGAEVNNWPQPSPEQPAEAHDAFQRRRAELQTDHVRRESARWLLEHDDILDVESPHEELPVGIDYFVSFSDLAACSTFEDLIAASLEIVRRHPGVEDVVHEDRELFVVTGRSVDPERLQSELHTWWREQLFLLARDPQP
jgi:hypothetical protein